MNEDSIIDIVPVTGPPHVLVRESRPEQDQRCFIVLDLSDFTIGVEMDSEPWDNAVPSEVYYGWKRRYNIPPLQPGTANALIEKMIPLAEKVADGALIIFDRVSGHHRCRLNASARNADDALQAMADQVQCDVSFWTDAAAYVDHERGNIAGMLRSGVSVDEVYHLCQGDGSGEDSWYVIGLRDELERMADDIDRSDRLRIVTNDSERSTP